MPDHKRVDGDTDGGSRSSDFLKSNEEKIKLYQYWYSKSTIEAIVRECEDVGEKVAFLSTPSVYFSLDEKSKLYKNSVLLDFDKAFDRAPGFVFYDYKKPNDIPNHLHHKFDLVVIDAPSVRDDVLKLYSRAADILLPSPPPKPMFSFCCTSRPMPFEKGKIIITSLAGVEHSRLMMKLFGTWPQVFLPTIPNLIYQYHIYANYPSTRFDKPNPDQAKPDPKKTSARSRMADFAVN